MALELFNVTNVAGVAVATTAVTVATNTFGKLIPQLNKKYTAFVFSLIIAFVIVAIADTKETLNWVMAFFNACLLYCTALGINQSLVTADTPQIAPPEERSFAPDNDIIGTITEKKTKAFFSSWL